MKLRNLLNDLPAAAPKEALEPLLTRDHARLERIVSHGHATPAGEWMDQDWDEWVLVLQGSAALTLAGDAQPTTLRAGDTLLLRAHVRHRVDWTDPAQATVWLCLHLAPERSED